MKLLLTAFDPFGGEKVNPAQKAVSLVGNVGGIDIVKLTVPTVFRAASRIVIEAIRCEKPDAVLCIGQAGGRAAITPERVAINLMDARIADNASFAPSDEPIFPSAPDAYFSSLPIKKMVEAIRERGIPAEVSNTAGTFVCNELMYSVLHALKNEFPNTIGGFMHVPFIPEQAASKGANVPSMNINDVASAIEAAIAPIAEHLNS
ncbi:MAG: pyroglutamyl-peptidase I [Clostridia bacterium]|nr:pyroglutamyl-peptidase I [Clostridia bacterium]